MRDTNVAIKFATDCRYVIISLLVCRIGLMSVFKVLFSLVIILMTLTSQMENPNQAMCTQEKSLLRGLQMERQVSFHFNGEYLVQRFFGFLRRLYRN